MTILAKPAIIWTALIYLTLVVVIGIWAVAPHQDAKDFFIAGQGIGLLVTALATMSAAFTGFVFIGGPGLTYRIGLASHVHLHPGELHRRSAVLGRGQKASAPRGRSGNLHGPRCHPLSLPEPVSLGPGGDGCDHRDRGLPRRPAQGAGDPHRGHLRHPRGTWRLEPGGGHGRSDWWWWFSTPPQAAWSPAFTPISSRAH